MDPSSYPFWLTGSKPVVVTRTMDEGLLGVKGESNLDISCSQWKYYLVIIVFSDYSKLIAPIGWLG